MKTFVRKIRWKGLDVRTHNIETYILQNLFNVVVHPDRIHARQLRKTPEQTTEKYKRNIMS